MKVREIGPVEFEKFLTDTFSEIDGSVFEISKKTNNYRYVIPFRKILNNNRLNISYIKPLINYEDCLDLFFGVKKMKENLFGELDRFEKNIDL